MNWSLAPPSGAVKCQVAAHRVCCVQHVVDSPLPAVGTVLAAGLGEEAADHQQAQRQARWCHPQARGGTAARLCVSRWRWAPSSGSSPPTEAAAVVLKAQQSGSAGRRNVGLHISYSATCCCHVILREEIVFHGTGWGQKALSTLRIFLSFLIFCSLATSASANSEFEAN